MIIYNHHYPQNIERLTQLYGPRFSNIFHLIPFYMGNIRNVIPIYENSLQFQGYIAQGFSIYSKVECEHFIFMADDLLLNPKVDENSYQEFFGLDSSSDFFPEFLPLHEMKTFWWRMGEALRWEIETHGIEISSLLPTPDQAMEIFGKMGWKTNLSSTKSILEPWRLKPLDSIYRPWRLRRFLSDIGRWTGANIMIHRRRTNLRLELKHQGRGLDRLSYPLVGGYSDLVVISRENLKKFAYYCGMFAAGRLHVELAIPTALVLSSKKVITEKNLLRSGRAYWGDEVNELDIYGASLDNLLANFPDDKLYIHPIKLSQWLRGSG